MLNPWKARVPDHIYLGKGYNYVAATKNDATEIHCLVIHYNPIPTVVSQHVGHLGERLLPA